MDGQGNGGGGGGERKGKEGWKQDRNRRGEWRRETRNRQVRVDDERFVFFFICFFFVSASHADEFELALCFAVAVVWNDVWCVDVSAVQSRSG